MTDTARNIMGLGIKVRTLLRTLLMTLLVTSLTAVLLVPTMASAGVGQTIRLQGYLTATGGGPAPDGDYGLTVSLYANKADTTALATYVNAGVKVKGGVFTMSIGATAKLNAADFTSGKAGWVGIKVGSDGELPRLAIHKVPYAIAADFSNALNCTGCVKAGQLDAAILSGIDKKISTVKSGLTAKLSSTDKAQATALKSLNTKLSAATAANKKAVSTLSNAIAKVGRTGQYGDLKNAPKSALADQTCKSGWVVVGIDSAGKVKCAADKTNALSNLDKRYVNEKQTNAVTGAMVANSSLTGADIKDGTIGANDLAPCPAGSVLQSNGSKMVCTGLSKTQKSGDNLVHNPTFSDRNKDAKPDQHSLRSSTSSAYYRYGQLTATDLTQINGFTGKYSAPSLWSVDLRSSNKAVDASLDLATRVDERTSFGAWVTCSIWVRRPDTVGTNAIAMFECFGKKLKVTIKKGDKAWRRIAITQRVVYPLPKGQRRMSIYGSGFATDGDPAYVRFALPKMEYGSTATAWNPAPAALPRGMIAFFAQRCPEGWSEYTALRGRVAVGTPSNGTIAATRGTALSNKGARVITQVPRHLHAVDPPNTRGTTNGNHYHSHDHANTSTTTNGSHRHYHNHPSVNTNTTGNHYHGIKTLQDDYNVSGGQGPSWGADNGPYKVYKNTEYAGNHKHSVNLPGQYSDYQGNHKHTLNLPKINSNTTGNHYHDVNIAKFNSASAGSSSVEVTMPYMQLVACYVR